MKKKDRNVFMDVIDKLFEDMIKEANGQDVTITFTKKGWDAHVDAKGNPVAILVALAGLESQILKKIGTSQDEFDMIKNYVNTKEVD